MTRQEEEDRALLDEFVRRQRHRGGEDRFVELLKREHGAAWARAVARVDVVDAERNETVIGAVRRPSRGGGGL